MVSVLDINVPKGFLSLQGRYESLKREEKCMTVVASHNYLTVAGADIK